MNTGGGCRAPKERAWPWQCGNGNGKGMGNGNDNGNGKQGSLIEHPCASGIYVSHKSYAHENM